MREFVTIIYVLALALGLGIYSASTVSSKFDGFDRLVIGPWKAHPASGTPEADPFAQARAARTGRLALGAAEGTTFVAERDGEGEPLSGLCSYRLAGRMPQARLWTLHVADPDGRVLPGPDPLILPAIHSRGLLHEKDGTFAVTFSRDIGPGNWVPLDHDGPIHFRATLYDTSVNSATGLTELVMPAISRLECRP